MNIRLRFRKLAEQWFLKEPAFFAIYCKQNLVPNPNMKCALRTGRGMLQYNAEKIDAMGDYELEELVAIEMLRLFLKHPYERRPAGCSGNVITLASDMVLTQNYTFSYFDLANPVSLDLPYGKYYEWYALHIADLDGNKKDDESDIGVDSGATDNDDGSQSDSDDGVPHTPLSPLPGLSDISALWQEDEENSIEINELIQETHEWGSLSGHIVEQIIASSKPTIDYRRILSSFRTSILSTRRILTRMKPNRRFGFMQMGSRYDFSTKLLIAVDTSGSITSEMLRHFFSAIIRFFRYGVEEANVIQFDTEVKEGILSLKAACKLKTFNVYGRGGTNFQPIFDYLQQHNDYDGLVVLTDGYAPIPTIHYPTKTRIVWICSSKENYGQHHEWMEKIGKACWMEI
jgi:predicted metal-dependent peptidase